jgi:Zn-dependent protease with chaperone function
MSDSDLAKCVCQHCGQGLEFPLEAAGMSVQCPSCEKECVLTVSDAGVNSEQPAPPASGISIAEIVAAFESRLPRTSVSPLYQIGLLIVAAAMIVLPILYLSLVGLVGFATYWWARYGTFVFVGGVNIHLIILEGLLYLAPLIGGIIAVFFMFKPLLARRAPRAQPLALNPAAEPVLFTFVSKVCESIGAPFPNRIDLDCHVNAAASFRRGLLSFTGNDLVLTIGLPLVSGVSVRQLAGILAHEFGHFTQGLAMRLTYIIRAVNGWFARVVYERDAWDVMLEEWSETEDWRMSIIVGFARLAVWLSRQVLRLLMMLGHGIGCFMLRQMEYDADQYEIKLVGSETFEETAKRIHVLGVLLTPAYQSMQLGWDRGRQLPGNFPSHLICHDMALPHDLRVSIEDRVGLQKTLPFDTHPSSGDRIRKARQAQEPGVFFLDGPAAALFSNFEVVAKQVTILHYVEDLRIPLEFAKLGPVGLAEADATNPDPIDPAPLESNPKPRLRIRRAG